MYYQELMSHQSRVTGSGGSYMLSSWYCLFIHADPTLKLRTFNAHIQELQLVTPQSAAVPYLDHINSCLHKAILSCRAAIESEHNPQATFPTPEKIPATKKQEHQWRFQKTTKTSGRKRNGLILR